MRPRRKERQRVRDTGHNNDVLLPKRLGMEDATGEPLCPQWFMAPTETLAEELDDLSGLVAHRDDE